MEIIKSITGIVLVAVSIIGLLKEATSCMKNKKGIDYQVATYYTVLAILAASMQ